MTLYETCLSNMDGLPMRRKAWDDKGFSFFITCFPLKKCNINNEKGHSYHALYEDIIANDWYVVK